MRLSTRGATLSVTLDCKKWNAWRKEKNPKWCSLVEENGWIYGYWVCGRPHGKRTLLYGEYPHSFLERTMQLFDGLDRETRLLHAPSGILTSDPAMLKKYGHLGLKSTPGVTVDLVHEAPATFAPQERSIPGHGVYRQLVPRCPQYEASVDALNCFEDNSFDVIISDPPYTRAEELAYDSAAKPYPLKGALAEAYRVLAPGGFFAMLHTYTGPPRSNKLWATRAVIAVVPSTQMNRTRTLCILQSRKKAPLSALFVDRPARDRPAKPLELPLETTGR